MTNAAATMGAVGALRKHWGWFLAMGIIFVIAGVFAIVMPLRRRSRRRRRFRDHPRLARHHANHSGLEHEKLGRLRLAADHRPDHAPRWSGDLDQSRPRRPDAYDRRRRRFPCQGRLSGHHGVSDAPAERLGLGADCRHPRHPRRPHHLERMAGFDRMGARHARRHIADLQRLELYLPSASLPAAFDRIRAPRFF